MRLAMTAVLETHWPSASSQARNASGSLVESAAPRRLALAARRVLHALALGREQLAKTYALRVVVGPDRNARPRAREPGQRRVACFDRDAFLQRLASDEFEPKRPWTVFALLPLKTNAPLEVFQREYGC
jgi:hypothetical protein